MKCVMYMISKFTAHIGVNYGVAHACRQSPEILPRHFISGFGFDLIARWYRTRLPFITFFIHADELKLLLLLLKLLLAFVIIIADNFAPDQIAVAAVDVWQNL